MGELEPFEHLKFSKGKNGFVKKICMDKDHLEKTAKLIFHHEILIVFQTNIETVVTHSQFAVFSLDCEHHNFFL